MQARYAWASLAGKTKAWLVSQTAPEASEAWPCSRQVGGCRADDSNERSAWRWRGAIGHRANEGAGDSHRDPIVIWRPRLPPASPVLRKATFLSATCQRLAHLCVPAIGAVTSDVPAQMLSLNLCWQCCRQSIFWCSLSICMCVWT